MKKIGVFVFVFIHFVATSQKNDLQRENIQGKVKNIVEITCETPFQEKKSDIKKHIKYNLDGNIIEEIFHHNMRNAKIVYYYDDNGQKIKNYFYENDEIKEGNEYHFDKEKNLLEIILFDDMRNQKRKSVHQYDKKGNEIEVKLFSKDKLSKKITYEYDDKNNQKKAIFYNIEGDIIAEKTFKYDEKGNRIDEITSIQKDSSKIRYNFQYTYDKMDNWVKEELYQEGKLIQVTQREICYYEN